MADEVVSIGGKSLVTQITDILKSAMNAKCSANVISLLCRSWFRQCVQIGDASSGSQFWVPSLLCRSECEQHWNTWMKCLSDIGEDRDAKRKFDTQMLALVV